MVRSLLLQLCRPHFFGVRVPNNSIRLPGFLAKNITRNTERIPFETQDQTAPQRGISCTLLISSTAIEPSAALKPVHIPQHIHCLQDQPQDLFTQLTLITVHVGQNRPVWSQKYLSGHHPWYFILSFPIFPLLEIPPVRDSCCNPLKEKQRL